MSTTSSLHLKPAVFLLISGCALCVRCRLQLERRLSFYFGSQTGTAEGFASELAENGDEDMFDIRIVDLEDMDPEEDLANDEISIFIVATYVCSAIDCRGAAEHVWH